MNTKNCIYIEQVIPQIYIIDQYKGLMQLLSLQRSLSNFVKDQIEYIKKKYVFAKWTTGTFSHLIYRYNFSNKHKAPIYDFNIKDGIIRKISGDYKSIIEIRDGHPNLSTYFKYTITYYNYIKNRTPLLYTFGEPYKIKILTLTKKYMSLGERINKDKLIESVTVFDTQLKPTIFYDIKPSYINEESDYVYLNYKIPQYYCDIYFICDDDFPFADLKEGDIIYDFSINGIYKNILVIKFVATRIVVDGKFIQMQSEDPDSDFHY